MTFNVDWRAIRPFDGSLDKGFEELCSQLARAETPRGAQFIRKGAPDAGVECYVVLEDGTEWGWQAKYFDTLGDSQWKQLDESVETAIAKHPQLVRYYVCVPLDRSDGRIDRKNTTKKSRSAMDRWNERVAKWREWAQEKSRRSLDFVWWGNSEMTNLLVRPENIGRLYFWFNKRGFDTAWFDARVDEAIKTAEARYTPELHIELPVAQDFEAFGRTQPFFNRIKALAIPVRDRLQGVRYAGPSINDTEIVAMIEGVSAAVHVALDSLGAISKVAAGPLPFATVAEKFEVSISRLHTLVVRLDECAHEHDAQQLGEKADLTQRRSNPFRQLSYYVRRLEHELRTAADALRRADQLAGSSILVLRGEAGTGKTHLLCDVVKRRLGAESLQPTVLLMGQRFVSKDAPWIQVMQQLDLIGLSAEQFVGALEAAAQAYGERALIVIDAVNEGTGRTIWRDHMAAFLAQIERSPWLGVVLSVRTSYENAIIPEEVRGRSVFVTHDGFCGHEYDAAQRFFVHYKLELPSTPLLDPEFQRPLFLKTLCRGLRDLGYTQLPRGFHGISEVFNQFLDAVNVQLAKDLDYDERKPLVRRAVEVFAAELANSSQRWLSRERAAQIIDFLLPNRGFQRSLFRNLIVEGVLAENFHRHEGTTGHDVVYLAYDRLADHLIAQGYLDKVPAPQNWAAAFSDGGVLAAVIADEYVAPGLLEALFVQVAERADTELIKFAPQLATRWEAAAAFRRSLIWRSKTAFSDATREVLFDKDKQNLHETLDVLLTLATVPDHPFNAKFLDKHLRKDAIAERDSWWSTYLSRAWGTQGSIDRLVDWAWAIGADAVIADDVLDLCGTSLAWMLTTPHRFLRDRATKALVNLFTGRLAGMVRLVDRFADVDDPYVTERVYAIAYGVAMRGRNRVKVAQ